MTRQSDHDLIVHRNMRELKNDLLTSQFSSLNDGFRESLQPKDFSVNQFGNSEKDAINFISEDMGSFGLSVLSYNILADAYTKEWNMDT